MLKTFDHWSRNLKCHRLHDSFGKFVQAAEMFGIQRTDGSLVIGGGYGPMRVTEEDLDHSNGYGVLPESLWHTYDLTVRNSLENVGALPRSIIAIA